MLVCLCVCVFADFWVTSVGCAGDTSCIHKLHTLTLTAVVWAMLVHMIQCSDDDAFVQNENKCICSYKKMYNYAAFNSSASPQQSLYIMLFGSNSVHSKTLCSESTAQHAAASHLPE